MHLSHVLVEFDLGQITLRWLKFRMCRHVTALSVSYLSVFIPLLLDCIEREETKMGWQYNLITLCRLIIMRTPFFHLDQEGSNYTFDRTDQMVRLKQIENRSKEASWHDRETCKSWKEFHSSAASVVTSLNHVARHKTQTPFSGKTSRKILCLTWKRRIPLSTKESPVSRQISTDIVRQDGNERDREDFWYETIGDITRK